MFILKSYTWWYTDGYKVFVEKVKNFFSSITDFFSMNSLIRTLFKPFRQISAETSSITSSLDMKFHMFLDRLISRTIGFLSRFVLLIVGCIILIVTGLFSLIAIILWPFFPFLPVAGIVFSIMGVVI